MTYAHDEENLYLAMYAETSTKLKIAGTELAISQTTDYPNEGKIKVSLNPKKLLHLNFTFAYRLGQAISSYPASSIITSTNRKAFGNFQ